jgi:hypothetical protein
MGARVRDATFRRRIALGANAELHKLTVDRQSENLSCYRVHVDANLLRARPAEKSARL